MNDDRQNKPKLTPEQEANLKRHLRHQGRQRTDDIGEIGGCLWRVAKAIAYTIGVLGVAILFLGTMMLNSCEGLFL